MVYKLYLLYLESLLNVSLVQVPIMYNHLPVRMLAVRKFNVLSIKQFDVNKVFSTSDCVLFRPRVSGVARLLVIKKMMKIKFIIRLP